MFAKNKKNKNKGQVLVLVALSLVVFIGFAALAIDLAYFYHTKNQLQGAADASALAGASWLTCSPDNDQSVLKQERSRQEAWRFACRNKAAGANVYLVTNDPVECNADLAEVPLDDDNPEGSDILVGNWDGTTFTRAKGDTGLLINAVKVVARREEDKPYTGGGVVRFFGRIFSLTRQNITTTAIAQGCNLNLAPISVNEYWMGENSLAGGGDCSDLRKPDYRTNKRIPYIENHVYPNSFVRPPCNGNGPPYHSFADNTSGNKCINPSNGNIDPFPTQSCDPPGPPLSQLVTVSPNGPLTSPCSGANCAGRPGGVGSTAGRVFVIAGGAASANTSGNMYSILNLDGRTNHSSNGNSQWFKVHDYNTYDPVDFAQTSPDKDIVANYIITGVYPNELPTSATEKYIVTYTDLTNYSSGQPYASTSYFNGLGDVGYIMGKFTANNFQNGKYNPGKQIIVAVYDGIVGDNGNKRRTTIVGFARMTIFEYGDHLTLSGTIPQVTDSGGTQKSMYGYVASIADSLKPEAFDFYIPGQGRTILVK